METSITPDSQMASQPEVLEVSDDDTASDVASPAVTNIANNNQPPTVHTMRPPPHGKRLRTEDSLTSFLDSFAATEGYAISLRRSAKKGKLGAKKLYQCTRSGQSSSQKSNDADSSPRKINCPFIFSVDCLKRTGFEWEIDTLSTLPHNHGPANNSRLDPLRQIDLEASAELGGQLPDWLENRNETMARVDAEAIIHGEIDSRVEHIRFINDEIHSNPELAYEEHQAHDTFVNLLTKLGFTVVPHAFGLETAFSAEYGLGGRLIIFNAEYDALPGIGHACGHNLIASASLAAFLGTAAALKTSRSPGRVRLLGTPAEEGGGGKLKLIEAGAYRGCAASLMVHPGPGYRLSAPVRGVSYVPMLANVKKRVHFTGREAHAAMAPWEGANALDAVCLSYNAIAMLRQQIRPYERIHGVFRQAGDRPNVIPAHCTVEYYVRSDTKAHAETLWLRVLKCFEGAALATECKFEVETLNSYADVRASKKLCEAYVDAMPRGTVHPSEPSDFLAGSTDMGDVCYECPGFHGAFGIDTQVGEGNHTKGFAAVAGTDESFDRAVECGKGMALVGWRMLTDDGFAGQVFREWRVDMKHAAEGN
ncbi:hypothetical protein N8I77_009637 [Diaporthe amygdali]|uniref:Peptidase M20 dimerisation domain-containing protein n=1 Tax=Phomopsis amygdali TaxID=1214568 RepID=A0AAD9SA78_PHOAM|nr:hypothetical protein N8I77_009637 [Diaporthe amygdali]